MSAAVDRELPLEFQDLLKEAQAATTSGWRQIGCPNGVAIFVKRSCRPKRLSQNRSSRRLPAPLHPGPPWARVQLPWVSNVWC